MTFVFSLRSFILLSSLFGVAIESQRSISDVNPNDATRTLNIKQTVTNTDTHNQSISAMYRSTQLARSTTRHIRKASTPRRPYSSALDPAGLTPKEDLMLDTTAWFVAIALVYSPDGNVDIADRQNIGELQNKANNRSKKGKEDPNEH